MATNNRTDRMDTTDIIRKLNSKCSCSSIVTQDIKAGILCVIHLLIKGRKGNKDH